MRLNAADFKTFIVAYEAGRCYPPGWGEKRWDAYDRLRDWLESNGCRHSSVPSLELTLNTVFDLPVNFLRDAYSSAEVVGSGHFEEVFLADSVESGYVLMIDAFKRGMFDKAIAAGDGFGPLVAFDRTDFYGLFSYLAYMVMDRSCGKPLESALTGLAAAYFGRKTDLGLN